MTHLLDGVGVCNFEAWYCAAAAIGNLVGERIAIRPYWEAGLSPREAVEIYLR